jgi:dihydrolipoamide dehydrogenase
MLDLIVIGGGPGGYAAAEYAAHHGMAVALVEKDRLGGTCLNWGCVPTKAYLHAAELAHAALPYAPDALARFDRRAMLTKKNEIVDTLINGIATLMKTAKVAVYAGTGTLQNAQPPFSVLVTDTEGAQQTLTAPRVLIATGSAPARLPVAGANDPAVFTSDDLLGERGAEPFGSLLIIGGGVIGVEMASVYARLGVSVTVVEAEARLLPMMDIDLSRSAEALLRGMGVVLLTGVRLQGIAKTDEGFAATVDKGGELMQLAAERVLLATGRVPVTEGLLAQGVTLAMNRRAIAVDEHYQTSQPDVYAIGDVNGLMQLAHAAHAQGLAAVSHMLGVPSPIDPVLVPSCVYTAPEIASVGVTQAEAKERGLDVAVGKALTTQNARTLIEGLGRGFVKLVFDKPSRKLIGAQLFCGRATDIVGELTLAIQSGLTDAHLLRSLRPHPTFEEAVTDAVQSARF